MNFLKLFLVALAPVLNTLFIAVIGAVLALDNIGILKKNTKKHLNIVSFISLFFFLNHQFFIWFSSLIISHISTFYILHNIFY